MTDDFDVKWRALEAFLEAFWPVPVDPVSWQPQPDAGFTLTPAAACKAVTVLGQAESRHRSGNARLALRLLDQATTSQACRITALPTLDSATLTTISPDDIPGRIHPDEPITDDERPGQYL